MLLTKEMFQNNQPEDKNVLQTKDAEDLGFSIVTDEDRKAQDLGYLSALDPNYQSMLANDDYYNMGISQ